MSTLARRHLIIKNIAQAPESKLIELFGKYGNINSCNFKNVGESNKKELHLEFETEESAQLAKSEVHNTVFEECILQVDYLQSNPIHITSSSSNITKNPTPVTQRIKKATTKPDSVKPAEKQIFLNKHQDQIPGHSIEDRLITFREEKGYDRPELTIIKPGAMRDEENIPRKLELRIQKSEDKTNQIDSKPNSEQSYNPTETISTGPPPQIIPEITQTSKLSPKEYEKKEEDSNTSKPVENSNTRSISKDKSQSSSTSNSSSDSKHESRSKSPELRNSRSKDNKTAEGLLVITKPHRSRSRDNEKEERGKSVSKVYGSRERDREHERDREKGFRDYRNYGYESKEHQDDYRSRNSREGSDYKRESHYYDSHDRERDRDSRYESRDHSSHHTSRDYRDNRDYRDHQSDSREKRDHEDYRDRDYRDSKEQKSHSDYRDRESDRDRSHYRSYESGKDRDYRDNRDHRDHRDRRDSRDHDRDYDRDRRDHDRDHREHRDYKVYGDRDYKDRDHRDHQRDYKDYDRSKDRNSREYRDHDYYGKEQKDQYDSIHPRGYDSYNGYSREKDYHGSHRDRYDDDYHNMSKNRDDDRDRFKRSKSRSRGSFEESKYTNKTRENSQGYTNNFSPKIPDFRHSKSFPGNQSFTVNDPLMPLLQNSLSNPLQTNTIASLPSVLSSSLPAYTYPYYTNPFSTPNYYNVPPQGIIPMASITPTTSASLVIDDVPVVPDKNLSININESKQLTDYKYEITQPSKTIQHDDALVVEVADLSKSLPVLNEKESEKENFPENKPESVKEKSNENPQTTENITKPGKPFKNVDNFLDPGLIEEFNKYPKRLINTLLSFVYSNGSLELLKAELNKPSHK